MSDQEERGTPQQRHQYNLFHDEHPCPLSAGRQCTVRVLRVGEPAHSLSIFLFDEYLPGTQDGITGSRSTDLQPAGYLAISN
jgi:hypothetical protein